MQLLASGAIRDFFPFSPSNGLLLVVQVQLRGHLLRRALVFLRARVGLEEASGIQLETSEMQPLLVKLQGNR